MITMTGNPNWPEITAALRPGEDWTHRPDIVNRVFKDKWEVRSTLTVESFSDTFLFSSS